MISDVHVIPIGDLKPHSAAGHCKCQPTAETQPNGSRLWTHNAWDGREFFESDETASARSPVTDPHGERRES